MAALKNATVGGFAPVSGHSQAGLTAKVVAVFRAAVAKVVKFYEEERTRLVLQGLTDSQLKDIGLSRSDIPAVSHGVFGGKR